MASQIATILPHDIDSEKAILYACIIEPVQIKRAQKTLVPEDFYSSSNAKIYSCILELGSDNFDLVGLRNLLEAKGILKDIGGEAYLMELGDFASTTAAIRYHIECVKSKSMRRQVIKACEDMALECSSPQADFQESMSSFKVHLKEIESEQEPDYVNPVDLFNSVYKTIETRVSGGSPFLGIPTGFSAIDDNLHGIEQKCTYYLAAERHTGKSALALNIAENVAEQTEDYVLYFTLESTKEAVAFRRLARRAKTDLTRLRIGSLYDDEMDRVFASTSELSNRNFIILERSRFQTYEVLASFCETFSLDKKISLIVIDYIQLLTSSKRFQNRHLELSHVSRCLNFLAKDLDCPVMILSQLNKEKGLKESGDIENNGDHIWILEREQHEREAKLRATKGKDTGTWIATLYFDKYQMTYSDFKPTEP